MRYICQALQMLVGKAKGKTSLVTLLCVFCREVLVVAIHGCYLQGRTALDGALKVANALLCGGRARKLIVARRFRPVRTN